MGASESVQVTDDDDEEIEEEEEERNDHGHNDTIRLLGEEDSLMKKVVEQEPELLPCHASASPLSPQPSSFGTPRLAPSIKVWDPCNVLSPPPQFTRSFSDAVDDDRAMTEVYLICQGECHVNLRPDLVGGRCPEATLTPNGKRQARALAVFLKSQGIRFNAVYTSPLDRARSTALPICQEMNFSEHLIQASEALQEISHGLWEGCVRSDVYTPEVSTLIERFQPDFAAPSGESLRQVEFRMLQFLNGTVVCLPEKLRSGGFSPPDHQYGPPSPRWDLLQKPKQVLARRKSGKSRLQMVTTTGDQEADEEPNHHHHHHHVGAGMSGRSNSSHCVAVFSHSIPIKCLLTGVLGCSPVMSNKICIEDSSVTLLQHSWKTGWQIKRLNDTSHLRLL
ncbi:uncharacterized protein LOC111888738 [Lactuca sativa]|uniref:Uncharacterized protein n=1 Tax=Lactuca sativa TaxID=4236 RepID=A0A9R1WEX8_LACSA|nr:uncharacterized protein LOC111888738 [Lactuca sativa]XP_023740630.1 uncharacterized protein LOC111888738 [Lactuca sativa]KAJ0221033.1 hypothetical protein LSAT_V11C200085030 [Lactuca sativa]